VTDHYAHDETEALYMGRNIVKNLKGNRLNLDFSNVREPLYDPSELNKLINVDLKKNFDSRELIARIFDGSYFQEFKQEYGNSLVTGFSRLYGQEVGILSNNGILFPDSAVKGAHFIEICCQRKIPLVFLQNITGFMVGK